MVNKSIILKEKELLSLLGDVIAEQNYEDDVKNMSYEEYLKKYDLQDNDSIRKRYNELVGEKDTKVKEEPEESMFGSCYELVSNPTNTWTTGGPGGNYIMEADDELSGWDTSEEYLAVEFQIKALPDTSEYVEKFPIDKYGQPQTMIKMTMKQGSRQAAIGWSVDGKQEARLGGGARKYQGTGNSYKIGPFPRNANIDITLKIPSNPFEWYEQAEKNSDVYNWPRYAGKNGSKVWVSGNVDFEFITDYGESLRHGRWDKGTYTTTCKAHIYTQFKFEFGELAKLVHREFIKNSQWDMQGNYDWDKSPIMPKNWDKHIIIDLIAIAFLIIAGFFSGGAGWVAAGYYISMGAYAILTGYNAILYYQEGNTQMMGIHLLFEALPYVKFGKTIGRLSAKVYSATLKKAFTSIGSVTGMSLKTNKNALKMLKNNPLAADMVKALAKYGDDTIKKVYTAMKKGAKSSDITDDVAREFMEVVAKEAPEIGSMLTIKLSKEIIVQQSRTFTNRFIKFLMGTGNIVTDATILATMYDVDMLWEPFQTFVLGRESEEVKTSGWPGLRDIQDLTIIELYTRYGTLKPRDLIIATKNEKGRHYNWDDVRNIYTMTITNPMIGNGKCDTIPSKRFSELYEKYKYLPATEVEGGWTKDEGMAWEAKQIAKTAGKFQGISIEASKLWGQPDVNLALKEDWLGGWRPEQKCHEIPFAISSEIEKKLRELLPDLANTKAFYEARFSDGLERYYEEMGEYLLLNGVEMKPDPTEESLTLVEGWDTETKGCFTKTMLIYVQSETWEEIASGTSDDFVTPHSPCIDKLK